MLRTKLLVWLLVPLGALLAVDFVLTTWMARDIARGPDAGGGEQPVVHHDSAIDRQPRRFGKRKARARRSSVDVSTARSATYVSMSLPCQVWPDQPWPRRSCAITRKPRSPKNIICRSQSSDVSGQPWLNTIGRPWPQSL